MSLNLYAYCQGNPVKYVDRDGNMPHIIAGILGGAVIGGVTSGIAEIIDQASSGKRIDWGKVGKKAAVGAIAGGARGAIVTTNPFAVAAANAGISAAEDAANQKIDTGKVDLVKAAKTGAKAGVTAGVLQKASNKVKKLSDSYKKKINKAKGTKKKQRKNILKKITKKEKRANKIHKTIKKIKRSKVYRRIVKPVINTVKKVKTKVTKVYRKVKARVRKTVTKVRRTVTRVVSRVKSWFSRWRW